MSWHKKVTVLVTVAFLGLVLSGCGAYFNDPPTAVISASPTSGKASLTVNFDGENSTDLQNNIESYEWDFGDGAGAMGKVTSHTYRKPGKYTACLTVTDRFNESDSDCTDITVENNPPHASFSASPTSGKKPLTVHFDGSDSSDEDGTVEDYEWDFGDGTSGTGRIASHTYTRTGTFTVTLTVTDDLGTKDSASQTINVEQPNRPPRCDLDANPTSGPAPLTVNFSGLARDPDGNIVRTTLDFGDGTSTSALAVSHTYNNPGRYIARLTVVDGERLGCDDSVAIQVGGANQPPVARFTGQRLGVLRYRFDASNSSDPDGFITNYNWIIFHPAWPRRTFSGRIITVNFPYSARVCVRLTVTDNQGARNTRQGCGQVMSGFDFESWKSEQVNSDAEAPDLSKEE